MHVEAELDALVEGQLRLARAVNVHHLLAAHEAGVVVDRGLNDAVTDRLRGEEREGGGGVSR